MNLPLLYEQNYTDSVANAYGQQNGTTLPNSTVSCGKPTQGHAFKSLVNLFVYLAN